MDSRIRRTLLTRVRDIPTLPTVLFRILDLTSDQRSNADDIAEAIHADHALAAKILRMINSAYYGLAHKISNIRHAVAMLGFRAIKNIVLSISIHETLIKDSARGGLDKGVFWQHAIAAGGCAYRIARSRDYPEPEEAYTAGLLHDIGKVVLDRYMKESYFKVTSALEERPGDACETERMVLGVTHAEVGGLVAEKWNFPPALRTAIESHHARSPEGIDSDRSLHLTAIVAVADMICWEGGFPSTSAAAGPRLPDWILRLVPPEGLDLEGLAADIDSELGRASEIFGLGSRAPRDVAEALDEAASRSVDLSGLEDRITTELETRALELSLVGEVVDRIRRLDDVEEIIRAFLSECRQRLHFDRVHFFGTDGPSALRLTYVLDRSGLRPPRHAGVLPVTDDPEAGPIESTALSGQPFLAQLDDASGRLEWFDGAQELGGASLSTSERLLGVVVVDNGSTGNPITEMAVQTLHLLALEVGMVVEKQHLLERYRNTEKLARTDELTGLFNRRHALAVIEHEIRRSRDRGTPLTVLLIDLDHFKDYNDRFGHDAGDRILRGVASRMTSCCRDPDTVARLGGDEYVVILPGTTPDVAETVARRILEDVERYGVEMQDEYPGGGLSLSGGIAGFDPEADDAAGLLKRADEALYAAKGAGRGQIRQAGL